MNIDEILNMIDDMLEEAWSLPFSGGRCVVDAQKVKECVEDIRLNLPGEIKQAKMIVADRNDIIKGAERQAESTLRKAEERARMLIAQEEIVKQAQEKAADIIAQAQMAAKEIRAAQPAKQNRCRFQRRVNPSGQKAAFLRPKSRGQKWLLFY